MLFRSDFLVEFGQTDFVCVDKGFEKSEEVDVVIRPEDIEIVSVEDGKWEGIVESVTFKGVHYEMIVKSNGFSWMIHSTIMREEGAHIGMDISPENIHVMRKVKDR